MSKDVLGYIDCPHCGTAKGMRITPDRNGEPFGFCTATCGGQLRVGGRADRVDAFLALYPWAKKQEQAAPAPVTGTGTERQAKPPAAPPPVPVPAPAAKPRSAFADAVAILGGAR